MEIVLIKEKQYFSLFKISLFLKGLNAIAEIFGGIFVLFTSKVYLVTSILNFFQNMLSDDPKDFIGNFIVDSAVAFSVSSQYFLGFYLFLHGIVKIFLVINLFRRKIWAYPVSIIFFSLLVVYQSYKLYFSFSTPFLIFNLLDILVVLLTIHEYGVLKKKLKNY